MHAPAYLQSEREPVDIHVGARIRYRRKLIGQSQSELAAALGVSFQQVQKYEKGANRVSASMLVKAAAAQGVTPAYYFDDLPPMEEVEVSPEAQAAQEWLASSDGWAMAEAMGSLQPIMRAAVLRVARGLRV